jgi:hypothetical protein
MQTAVRATALATVAAFMLAGCAADPASIAPSYVSPVAYQSLDCQALGAEAARLTARLTEVTGQQQANADADAALMGIGLIILWPALLAVPGGDQSAELARLRGEAEALQAAATARGC